MQPQYPIVWAHSGIPHISREKTPRTRFLQMQHYALDKASPLGEDRRVGRDLTPGLLDRPRVEQGASWHRRTDSPEWSRLPS